MEKQRIAIFDSDAPDLTIISVINLTQYGPPPELNFGSLKLEFWKITDRAVYYVVKK